MIKGRVASSIKVKRLARPAIIAIVSRMPKIEETDILINFPLSDKTSHTNVRALIIILSKYLVTI
jgi:hypothetical protein